MTNRIIWHQLPNESLADRIARLNKDLHRIFFDFKEVCPEYFADPDEDGFATCQLCRSWGVIGYGFKHGTPRFLKSLDAMQLIVESGRFAEVREEFYHWLLSEGKPAYECSILLYRTATDNLYFMGEGRSRQEAFYLTALKAVGYEVIQGESSI